MEERGASSALSGNFAIKIRIAPGSGRPQPPPKACFVKRLFVYSTAFGPPPDFSIMRIGHKTIFQWLLGASLLICASVASGCGSGPAQDASRPDFPVPETRYKSNGDFP